MGIKKSLYIDIETTGLDSNKHEIIQLAGLIVVGGKVEEEFNYRIKPLHLDLSDSEVMKALDINSIKVEDLASYEMPYVIHKHLTSVLGKHVDKYNKKDKYYLVGYNVGFDLGFLEQFFILNSDNFLGSWLNWKKIDVLQLVYFLDYLGILGLPNYKLGTVCDYFKIKLDNAHDALADIKATRELLKLLYSEYYGKLCK
jgi:DNA polymerase-3 subunit epsilon